MEPVVADLERLAQRLLRDLPPEEAVASAWPLVCGSSVAAKAVVESLAEGVLVVSVPSREWVNELNTLRGLYVEKLSQLCPGAVKGIKFLAKA